MTDTVPAEARLEAVGSGDRVEFKVAGRLDVHSTPTLWRDARRLLDSGTRPSQVDVSNVTTCDSAGAAWLVWLDAPVVGANTQVAAVVELARPRTSAAAATRRPPLGAPPHDVLVARIGHAAEQHANRVRWKVGYIGSLVEGVAMIVRRPRSLRRGDLFLYMSRTGYEALPIVALISFLVGVIIAYQAAMQLRQFGTEIYVADAVAISMCMELGPLMTAIIMAGRSGSAFAAEIGTMKVNEEIDAIDTMGLDSTRFLVMPKFLALALMMPVLVTFADMCGIAGGLAIGTSAIGVPAPAYLRETTRLLTVWRVGQGFIKGECYALVIGAVGCLRGLQTKAGAQGVGLSATSAVVTSIFYIVVVDAFLTVIFQYVPLK
jgi:phospholipid/cholesterol/gamma-HCH transport system permease protein